MEPTVNKERRFAAQRAVLHSVKISFIARLIYFELDDRAGYRGNCWPKQETMAANIGASVRAIRDALGELTDRGVVRIERRQRYQEYFLTWADRQDLPIKTGKLEHADRQTLPITAPVSINEPYQEQRKEQRCSLCGGSGYAGGTTGADIAICECAVGDAIRRSA